MPIHVACPKCRKPLTFDDAYAGSVAQCPCGQQMMLPAAPPAPAPSAPAPRTRPMPAPHRATAARPAGGGGGAIVLGILLLLVVVGGVVLFNRSQKEKVVAEQQARRDEAEAQRRQAEAEADRYVMVRWAWDDAVLPPDRRIGAGSEKLIGVRVEVANRGFDSVEVNPEWFTLVVDGAPYGRPVAIALEPLAAGRIAQGTKAGGGIAFEVSEPGKTFTLEFRPPQLRPVNVRYGEMR